MNKLALMQTKRGEVLAGEGALKRRGFLGLLGAGGALLVTSSAALLPGCGHYPPEEGAAYEPWDFPGGETTPERIAVAAAILAASPHNTQPWLFVVRPGEIEVQADLRKSLGAMDPLGREMYLGLGCAVENLVLAAGARGQRASVAWLPEPGRPELVARVTFNPSEENRSPLSEVIAARHTNRGAYLEGAAPAGLGEALRGLVDDAVVSLVVLGDPALKGAFREGTIAATRAIVEDEEMNDASHAWWRQTREEIERHRDGLTIDATGLGAATTTLGKVTGKPSAAKAGAYWISNTEGPQTTGFAFCVLSTEDRGSREQQLRCGRVFQRMHLWATSQGLAVQPLNQMAERQDREEQRGLAPEFGARLGALAGAGAQMLFRIGVAWDEAGKSPRRPVAWVVAS
jgi:nitroreductase